MRLLEAWEDSRRWNMTHCAVGDTAGVEDGADGQAKTFSFLSLLCRGVRGRGGMPSC